jgi:hypothetical protein
MCGQMHEGWRANRREAAEQFVVQCGLVKLLLLSIALHEHPLSCS